MSERTMSPHELSRVIDFLRKLRQPFDTGLPGAKPDAFWNTVLELVDANLHQVPVTITTLIELSQASYGAGNRLITKMIEDGQIVKVPRGPQHKTVYLAPSDELLAAFQIYASQVKAHLARTFGLRSGVHLVEDLHS